MVENTCCIKTWLAEHGAIVSNQISECQMTVLRMSPPRTFLAAHCPSRYFTTRSSDHPILFVGLQALRRLNSSSPIAFPHWTASRGFLLTASSASSIGRSYRYTTHAAKTCPVLPDPPEQWTRTGRFFASDSARNPQDHPHSNPVVPTPAKDSKYALFPFSL